MKPILTKTSILLIAFALFVISSYAQTPVCESNMSFELGNFTKWKYYEGTFKNTGTGGAGVLVDTLQVFPPSAQTIKRFTITSGTTTDFYGGFPIADPTRTYSLKLGFDSINYCTNKARYFVHVPAGTNDYALIYRYAIVMQDPGHTSTQQPRFLVKTTDSLTGATLPGGYLTYVAGSLPGFNLSSASGGTDVYYKSWATACLNLSGYAGKTVIVEFEAVDCALGGHWGYGYFDMTCGLFAINLDHCEIGVATSLTAPPGFASYKWTDSSFATTLGTGSTFSFVTPATSKTYHVICTPYTGYGLPDTLTTRIVISNLAVHASNDTTVCNGSTVPLSAGATGGAGSLTYAWSPAATLSCSSCANPNASPSTTTKYYVTVTDSTGCGRTDSVIITVNPLPAAITGPGSVCVGAKITLSDVTAGGTWISSATSVASVGSTTGVVTGISPGTAIISYKLTSTGCIMTKFVTVNALPSASTTTLSNVACYAGSNGSVSVTPTGGTSPYTYSWNSSPVQTTATATGLAAGTYIVTVTDAQSCITTVTATVTQPTTLTATASTLTNVACNGGNDGSMSVTPAGGTSPYTYSWNSSPVQTTATATGLATGTYTVTVTDAHNCITTASATVTQPSALAATSSTLTNVACNGGNNGSASVTPTGGTLPYSYSWNSSPVQNTATATGLTAGNYTVVVTDAHNCTVSNTVTITQPTTLGATAATLTNVACNGGSDGSVSVTPTGGTLPYTFSWNSSPVQTTATATGLTAGTYTVTVTDAHSCVVTATATITQPTSLTTTASTLSNALCNGVNTGSVKVIAAGGTSPYTYSWSTSPVQTTATATGLTAGTYSVVVTDAHGCTSTASSTVTQPSTLTAVASTLSDVSCNGGSNGSVTVVPSGGTTPYSYSWGTTPVRTTATITSLVAGTYIVTVTDANNCTVTEAATVVQPTTLTASASTLTNIACNGGTEGSMSVTPAGGTSPYTYSWNSSPVQTTATATGLGAGTYTATVTDAHNCTTTATATITQPTTLTGTTSTLTNVACNGGSNGSVKVTPTGGTTPYTYSWSSSPVQTTATATGLPAGTYTVAVTDAHNCTFTGTATVTEPTILDATASTLNNVACNGGNNGSVSVTPTGGTSPYTYSWSTTPVKTTATASGLTAGTYTVTVTDAHACTTTASATVTEPTDLTATASTLANVSCNGGNNGSVSVTPAGGTSPYTYSWNSIPAQTTATATGLTAGTYTVTVRDAHNCATTATATVTQPTALTVSASTLSNVACNGGTDGSVSVTPGGGTSPYTYSWNSSPVQTTATATGLSAGTYTVTVTDAHSCTISATATVTQPTILASTATTLTNVACNGGNNGSVKVTPTGGTLPYAYSWTTSPAQTTATATGLIAGTYTAIVTDAHGCVTNAVATVTEPTELDATASTLTNVACNGGNNGSVSVTPTGGTSPYTYSWSTTPVKTTATATGLVAGTYTVTVTDAHSCTTTDVATVTEPTALAATAATLTNVACNGGNDGSVSVTPTGGTLPYTYGWNSSPVQTTATATELAAGTYTVTVTDAHNCTTTAIATVTQPAILASAASTLTNVACNGGTDGSVNVTPTGGTLPYTYSWSTSPVQTTATATGLAAGTYTATVTDAHNCVTTATATIAQPTALTAVANTLSNALCNGVNTGSVIVVPTGGTSPYTYSWSTAPVQTTANATGLTAGTYSTVVTDAHGCTATAATTVTQPSTLTATATTLADVSCHGGNNGSVTVAAAGGTTPYFYSWGTTPVQTTATVSGLIAGTYVVTVSDANNCSVTTATVVTEPTVLAATATTLTNVACNSGNDGSASVTPTGGTSPYTYSWSTTPAQTGATATSLTVGSYTVTVTDAHNCVTTASATITEPTTLAATASTQTNVACNGGNDGSVTVSPTGGTIPYTYSWNTTPAQTTATATGLTAGTYTVTVTDAHNCSTTAATTITEPTQLAATAITISNASCNGANNGSVSVTPTGGTSPYTYHWNTTPVQSTATATGLVAGTYTVTVTDAHNCSATATAEVTEPTTLTATASTLTDVSCNAGSNGSVSVTPAGGTTPYTYSWSTSPAQTTATATGLAAGTYTVTVADANNCSTTATATVAQPTPLTATASTLTDVACNGGNDGSVNVAPTGGTAPYAYNWSTSPVQTDATATGLTAGSYTVTVTDAHSCTTTATAAVTEPVTLTATAATISNALCNGINTGSVDVAASGGTTPYNYSWSTSPVQTTSTASGLPAGIYTVTVTDAHNCATTASTVVTQPSTLVATASTLTNVSCNGGNDGSVSVDATGGTTPYVYSWSTSPAQVTATATGLSAGNYTVTVTDGHLCSVTSTTTVIEPTLLTATASTVMNIACNGGNNGSAIVIAEGGTAPYSYSWSTTPAQTTSGGTGLTAGTYTVTVTDDHGCTATSTATVTEPTTLTAATAIATNVSCYGSNNGSATAIPGGGTQPYGYSWSTTPMQSTVTASGLTAGTYTVTVTDSNGCIASANATITQPDSISLTANVTDASCQSGDNGAATIIATGGTAPYTYLWDGNARSQTTATASGLKRGTYNVTVTDSNGCSKRAIVIVNGESTTLGLTSNMTTPTCNNEQNGSINVNTTGGLPPFSYAWSNGATTTSLQGLAAGTYSLTVTDSAGCSATATYVVTQPDAVKVTLAPQIYPSGFNTSGYGTTDGAIKAVTTGGTPAYAYLWSTGSTDSVLAQLGAGTYSITVTDQNGCQDTASIVLTGPNVLELPTGYSPNGDGKNDYFVIHGINAYPNNRLVVFNRWGNEVYSTDGYNNTWNGQNNNGKDLPDGTYFVVLTINGGAITKNGYVDLRR